MRRVSLIDLFAVLVGDLPGGGVEHGTITLE
jgi:hypothetical protein